MKMLNIKIVIIILIIIIIQANRAISQFITGTVYEITNDQKKSSLPGANVFWINTTIGVSTDDKGNFKITKKNINDFRLVVSFLGYMNDTIKVNKDDTKLDIQLFTENKQIGEINIKENNGSYISKINPRQVQVITTTELYKAACCNLSESFETNASVDVSYSDAVSGAKQIQLLGLSGVYSQIQTENIPSVRGLASSFGLNYIPGSWMESIQIAKGTASVINGYESTTGQINVEYKKPANSEHLFVNLYANSNQRLEANILSAVKLTDKLSTMVMLHGDDFRNKFDRNHDSFMDQPKVTQYNIFNRWDYINNGKMVSRFGIKYLEEKRIGGMMNYDKNTFVLDTAAIRQATQNYGIEINTKRTEVFWKNGIMFPGKPYQSLGLILSGVNHEQTGNYGINIYDAKEKSMYANLIFQSIIVNTNHKYSVGLSYILDDYKENYIQTIFNYSGFTVTGNTIYNNNFNRQESVPGVFAEYTFNYMEKFTVIAGLRADYHNIYGAFLTPRLHLRYYINESTIIRASVGKGYRTANVIAENLSILASQRKLVFLETTKQEQAWNYGINMTKEFKLFNRKAEFDIDIYRTDFVNQVIVDMDSLTTEVFVYNLKGKSYSNCYQVQFTFEPVKSLTVLLAYRINDVKTTINNQLREKPFVNNYKGLVTLSYATKFDKWKFDITGQFNGTARLPEQKKMPVSLRRATKTPEYFILNAQITKKFKYYDIYLGGENLTNFTQNDPITQWQRPFHKHFDTSMVWGPIVGRVIYGGIRLTIK